MRFLIPSQTISEYRHQQMPVYETLATVAAGVAIAGTVAGTGMEMYSASQAKKGLPSYGGGQYVNPETVAKFEQEAQGYVPTSAEFQNAQQAQESNLLGSYYNPNDPRGFAQQFARAGTQQQINLQNQVTPGSSAQRELAQRQLNSYIQGQVPADVQQNINRQVAQNLGGGFNLFNQGGQAPANFARNIGQTSLGLSQYGLSAAPTWQQLANSMVVSPVTGAQLGMQAGQLGNQQVLGTAASGMEATRLGMQAAGMGVSNAENQYQAGMNQYGANQASNQAIAQGLTGLGSAGTSLYNAANMSNYYGGLATPQQGTAAYGNQFGSDMQSSTGFMETPAAVQAAYGAGAIPAYYSGGGQSGYYNQGFTS